MASWNFSGWFRSWTCPVSNHSAIMEHNVSYSSNLVLSCSIRFCNAVIVLILNSICGCAGHCIIWLFVSCCSYRQQLWLACYFYVYNIVAVGNRSLHIFTSRTSLSILFNPRLRPFHAIDCIVLSVPLYLSWRHRMYIVSVYALMKWWGDIGYWSLLSYRWFLTQQVQINTYEWLVYMTLIRLADLLEVDQMIRWGLLVTLCEFLILLQLVLMHGHGLECNILLVHICLSYQYMLHRYRANALTSD